MSGGLRFPELEKNDRDTFSQKAFEAGRKHRGEFDAKVLVNKYGVPQTYVNANWDRMKRAWETGANPKPMPKAKPRGLGMAKP